MEGRPAVQELVRRVMGGTPIDEAAAGLALDWDEHGLHASDYLLHAVVWAGVDDATYVALVDWFLARGADGARLLAAGLEDRGELGRIPPMVEHLLARRPLPDLGPALRTAFRLRRETTARRLIALGADAGVLGQWVQRDLITPANVEARYRASADEQRVELHLRLLRLRGPGFADSVAVQARARRLLRLGENGLLGSDVFAPSVSHIAEESLEVVEHPETNTWSAKSVLRVRGVSPAGLALSLRSLVARDADLYPIAIRLVGELAPNGDARSVDDARATSWFRDASIDAVRAPTELGFAITAKPKKKTFAVLEHAAPAAEHLAAAVAALEDPLAVCAIRVGWDSDGPPEAELLEARSSATKTEIVLKRYLADGRPPPDRASLRALILAAAARANVTALRWADDANVSTEAPSVAAGPAPTKARKAPKR